jgi:hypothetical protein
MAPKRKMGVMLAKSKNEKKYIQKKKPEGQTRCGKLMETCQGKVLALRYYGMDMDSFRFIMIILLMRSSPHLHVVDLD